jgi:hypothetical protein
MTGDEVRAICLRLPETTEKETWGDQMNAGHPTFLDFESIPAEVLRETIQAAWERTAPKKVAASWRASR